jgi:hypothetical protein
MKVILPETKNKQPPPSHLAQTSTKTDGISWDFRFSLGRVWGWLSSGCRALQSRRNWLTFQRCLLSPEDSHFETDFRCQNQLITWQAVYFCYQSTRLSFRSPDGRTIQISLSWLGKSVIDWNYQIDQTSCYVVGRFCSLYTPPLIKDRTQLI